MADESENKSEAIKPASPGFKKFGGAKLVPPPAPIPQLNDKEKFPVFLGVLIVMSILALVTVFVLAFFSEKTKSRHPVQPEAVPAQSAGASASVSPRVSPAGGAH